MRRYIRLVPRPQLQKPWCRRYMGRKIEWKWLDIVEVEYSRLSLPMLASYSRLLLYDIDYQPAINFSCNYLICIYLMPLALEDTLDCTFLILVFQESSFALVTLSLKNWSSMARIGFIDRLKSFIINRHFSYYNSIKIHNMGRSFHMSK